MLAPCPKTTEPQDVKSIMVLEHTIDAIRTGNGKWKNKTDCLVNHFNQILMQTQATLQIVDFDKFDSALYDYTFLNVLSSTMTRVTIPQAGANQVAFRTNARYVAVEMTVNPRRRYTVVGLPGNGLLPDADTKSVLFRLPHGPDGGTLHDAIHLRGEILANEVIREKKLRVTKLFLSGS